MSLVIDPPKGQIKTSLIRHSRRIEVVCSDGRIAVSVAGELDESTNCRLGECLHNAIDDGMGHIVVDLAAVTYMDSRALTVLVQVHRRMAEAGGTIVIIRTSPLNIRLFIAAGLASYLSKEQCETPR